MNHYPAAKWSASRSDHLVLKGKRDPVLFRKEAEWDRETVWTVWPRAKTLPLLRIDHWSSTPFPAHYAEWAETAFGKYTLISPALSTFVKPLFNKE
jgi:hypothetical protein